MSYMSKYWTEHFREQDRIKQREQLKRCLYRKGFTDDKTVIIGEGHDNSFLTPKGYLTTSGSGYNPFDIEALKKRKAQLEYKEFMRKLHRCTNLRELLKIQRDIKPRIKQDKMKTKKFYHTFNFKRREITLCLLTEYIGGDATIKIGYAVRVPEDKAIEGLSKKIALGRAEKGKLLTEEELEGATEYFTSMPILKGIALHYENQVQKGFVKIKGIR